MFCIHWSLFSTQLTLLHDLELKELTKGVIVPEGGVKENNIHKVAKYLASFNQIMQGYRAYLVLLFVPLNYCLYPKGAVAQEFCKCPFLWGRSPPRFRELSNASMPSVNLKETACGRWISAWVCCCADVHADITIQSCNEQYEIRLFVNFCCY